MKLLAGLAVMDAVDNRGWSLDEPVTVRKENLSLYVQPIADIVKAKGSFQTTVGDLVRRAIVDSDSAAADILVERLGGPAAVQAFLDRKGIHGVRFDRDEKRLQTEIVGLTWKPEFVDSGVLDRAIKAVPAPVRDAANRRYQTDVRDTATPLGMATVLISLANGSLLSGASTRHIIDVMTQTVTFPDRLKAGVAPGWAIAHKTGTSGTWQGMTIATNDVGILTAPGGGKVAIAVFIADSRTPDRDRAALMAKLARATISHYSQGAPLR
jgi:beta-lactamase class A